MAHQYLILEINSNEEVDPKGIFQAELQQYTFLQNYHVKSPLIGLSESHEMHAGSAICQTRARCAYKLLSVTEILKYHPFYENYLS